MKDTISNGNHCGKSADVDLEAVSEWKQKLQQLLRDYDVKDIFNADETGQFFCQMPTKSFVEKPKAGKGGKKWNDQLTVLLCCSTTEEKLKPIIIGHSA